MREKTFLHLLKKTASLYLIQFGQKVTSKKSKKKGTKTVKKAEKPVIFFQVGVYCSCESILRFLGALNSNFDTRKLWDQHNLTIPPLIRVGNIDFFKCRPFLPRRLKIGIHGFFGTLSSNFALRKLYDRRNLPIWGWGRGVHRVFFICLVFFARRLKIGVYGFLGVLSSNFGVRTLYD